MNDKTKKGGGVRAYAAEIGKGENSVSEWVKAADVYMFLSRTSETKELNEKTKHLYEISKAPQDTWQILADLLIKCDWSVKDTPASFANSFLVSIGLRFADFCKPLTPEFVTQELNRD